MKNAILTFLSSDRVFIFRFSAPYFLFMPPIKLYYYRPIISYVQSDNNVQKGYATAKLCMLHCSLLPHKARFIHCSTNSTTF